MLRLPMDGLCLKQAVSVAVGVDLLYAVDPESCLCLSLRVQLYKLNPMIGYGGEKGDVVLSGHRMIHAHIVLVLRDLRPNPVLRVCRLRFQRRQRDPAAADNGLSGCQNHVAADRADVKPAFCHIGRAVPVPDILPGQQFNHRDIECF